MEKIWRLLGSYGGEFLKGLGGTLSLAAATVVLGTALGILVALLRMSRFRAAHGLARLYTEVLRGTPILLQLYFFGLGCRSCCRLPFRTGPASWWLWW